MASAEYYMKLALGMAEMALGQTSPNPAVGCVIVKNGVIVGLGAHLQTGKEHAEVHALVQAGELAKGADVYITLEPCAHQGRTPPCADLLINQKVGRVYIAALDPNPLVAGNGLAKLQQAGIPVELGICQAESLRLNKYFMHYMKTKKPYVTLKTAVTIDGKTASYTGDSKWITSKQTRLDVHLYRHQHDAILVGINTIMQDNPRLTTRLPRGGKNPIRIVLDTNLRIPLDSHVVTDQKAATWIVCGSNAPEEKQLALTQLGIKVKKMSNDQINLSSLLVWLGKLEITSLLVEGGSTVLGSFLDAGCFQELIFYVAPILLGGRQSYPSFAGIDKHQIADGRSLHFKSVEMIGPDIKIIAEPVKVGGEDSCLQES